MTLQGKGFYIWKLHQIANGNVAAMAAKASAANLTHVLIKIADGDASYNTELAGPATEAFKAANIQVWGWAWAWMRNPAQEALVAAERTRSLGLDGFVVNAEHPTKGKPAEARAYMDVIRDRLGALPVGLSSYRYPQFHTSLPWEIFLSQCDLNLPQMYWVGESPESCVRNATARHEAFSAARPIIPTGAAYGERYGGSFFRARPDEITRFLDAVRSQGLSAANFWSWDWAEANGPDLWDAVADYEWPIEPEVEVDVASRFWVALTGGDLDTLASLYHDNAVHITAGHTAQGPAAIRTQFAELLGSLPEAEFQQIDLQVEENVRFLRWRVISPVGSVSNGLDTIGVRAGKIQYHASSYELLSGSLTPQTAAASN